ncbi:MAG: DUF1127 domain-containing protein [Hasllibacter sp.]
MLRALIALDALHRSRHALRHLPDHRLRDLGLAPGEARAEADRPAWDGPAALRAHGMPEPSAGRSVSGSVRLSRP